LTLSPIEPVRDAAAVEGRFVLALVRDATDRRRAEEEVRRLNGELEERVKERTARLEATLDELRSNEGRLLESEERFKAAFEQAAVGMAYVGVDGRWLRVNQKLCDIVGYPREELLSLRFQDITYPEDLEMDLGYLRRLLTGEIGTYSTEKRYFRKDGSIVWINLTVSSVREVSGETTYFISVIEDISQRKQAEEALRMSERRFRTVIEQSPLSVQILSPDGRTLRVNRAWEELWGVTLEDIEGYNMLEDQQLVAEGIMPYIQKGFAGEPTAIPPIAYDPEQTIPGLSSNEEPKRWVRAFIYPVTDEAGNIREVVLVHEDVTERKRAEETLRESEERYRAVIEQSAEGLYLLDARTKRVIQTNPSLQRMLGYSEDELRGMELYDLIELPREEVDATLRRTLERGYRPVGERKYRRKDGGLVDVEIGASVIRYGGGEVVCALVRDVTERKRVEGALREVREAERRRLARDLHDGVLQDLSYTAVSMGLMIIEAEGTSLEQRLQGAIDAVRRAAQGLRYAVNDLRREDEGDRPLPILLEHLVERNGAMAQGQALRLYVEEGFPSEPLGKAGVEVLRIVQEAMSNARRHSGASTIQVKLRAEENDLVVEVTDDGRGFAPGAVPGVGSRSMRERAMGIGGKLEIDSRAGQGTRVCLRVSVPQQG
jgi:PAS domain S-box-containing protein